MPPKGTHKTDSKDVTIRCRVTKDLNNKLETYCKEKQTTKSQVMVEGIKTVIEKK